MRKIFKIPLYIMFLCVLGILAGHLTFKLLSFSRSVEVPDMRGKSMIESSNLLRERGLYIRLEGEDHDAVVPVGFIVRQDVPPGSKVKEGREIRVIVSRGPKVTFVPDLVGQTLEDAEGVLREKGLRIGRVLYVHSEGEPKGIILAQRPESSEKGGDAFNVVVSLGTHEEGER